MTLWRKDFSFFLGGHFVQRLLKDIGKHNWTIETGKNKLRYRRKEKSKSKCVGKTKNILILVSQKPFFNSF